MLLAACVCLPIYSQAQEFNYHLDGHIKGLGNDTVVLNVMQRDENKGLTIELPARDDQFTYTGKAAGVLPVFAQIKSKRGEGNIFFFLDKGSIHIQGDMKELDYTSVTGTPINDDFNRGNQVVNSLYKKRQGVFKVMEGLDKNSDAFKANMLAVEKINREVLKYGMDYIQSNPSSMFSAMQLYLIFDKISVLEAETFLNSLKSPAKDLFLLAQLPGRIASRKKSEVGKPAPAFEINDVNGKVVKLSDYKGQYVLLDFWASWCVPCRKEIPGLKAGYEKYQNKGFKVISVSSDTNEKSWKKAISDEKVEYWIHVSDLKGLGNRIAGLYGVQPIPDNFLIDPNGNIIARNLFGKELEKKLGEVFAQE